MRIIDTHMHIGLSGHNTDSIIKTMNRKGVDQSWLLTWEEIDPPIPGIHMDLEKGAVLEACTKYPDRLIPFYAPDPAAKNLGEQFAHFQKLGIRGCGELKVSRNWDDPLIESYLEMVQNHGFLLVFHMEKPRMQYIQEKEGLFHWLLERLMNDKYNGVSRYYISQFAEKTGILRKRITRNQVQFPGILYDFISLEKRVRQFPGIRFIGHGPGFWNAIGTAQHPKYIHQKGSIKAFGIIDRMLEEYDNFYCDISGTSGYNALNRDRKRSKFFLQKHAHKILYGTDNTKFPLLELLHSMNPGNDQLEMILHKNALKVLR